MRRWDRKLAGAIAPVLAATVAGCAIVDDFSGRAVDFNLQAEQVQEQSLLLNVVRASLRRPMQFTGLQSMTGTASVSGGSTLSFPFGEATHRPKTAASPDVFGLSGTVSGGPTFIVPDLDTQEFYEGMLSPISLQIFDYYLQQGFPKEILFDLFVSKIVVTQVVAENGVSDCRETTFNNSVGDDVAFDQYQALIDMLLAAGLSTEHIETTSTIGPEIAAKALQPSDADGGKAAALIQAYAAASSAGLKFSAGQGTDKGNFHLEKSETSYRFCFEDPGPEARKQLGTIGSTLFCNHAHDQPGAGAGAAPAADQGGCSLVAAVAGAPATPQRQAPSTVGPGTPDSGGNATLHFSLSNAALATLGARLTDAIRENPGAPDNLTQVSTQALIAGAVSFKLQVRSTEGILYYLGEVTRRHLYPETAVGARRRMIQVPTRVPRGAMPATSCRAVDSEGTFAVKKDGVYLYGSAASPATASYNCENLFVVDESPGGAFISVDYDGTKYGLPGEQSRVGRTYQVLELVKQIMAVNTSAKAFPATNVISIISSP